MSPSPATVMPTTSPILALAAAANAAPMANGQILQQYESLVWSTADTLRGAGFTKESDWPKFMMPFFALMLIESRILRARNAVIDEYQKNGIPLSLTTKAEQEIFFQQYQRHAETANGQSVGYHEDLVLHGQGMAHITSGASPASFLNALQEYLAGFDEDTQRLLGVDPVIGTPHYLDIRGVIGQLEGKKDKPLLEYCRKWAAMDLTGFDSSEVTTLEEHLKRRWGDISAETSGEQYTPRDLISLVSKILINHFQHHPKESRVLEIYDPTCGGGNMIFGVEDNLRQACTKGTLSYKGHPYSIHSYGQEINDQLYALASIESRFRPSADIREGNTLTDDRFSGHTFDAIVANPPYGIDWKDVKPQIEADLSGRFDPRCFPPTSDGQQLFLQHIFSHLKDDGVALVFCSGSTLFSGDAGGGESNSRSRLIMNEDGVFGIFQMPKNEFFNTGINTYLWFFWKKKPDHLKGAMFLMDAENAFQKLRKSLGSKTNEIPDAQQDSMVDIINRIEFQAKAIPAGHETSFSIEGPIPAKFFPVDHVHYNKVNLVLTREHPVHGSLARPVRVTEATLMTGADQIAVLAQSGQTVAEAASLLKDAAAPTEKGIVSHLKQVATSGVPLLIRETASGRVLYSWDADERVLRDSDGNALGQADLSLNAKWKTPKGGTEALLHVEVTFARDFEKDTENTPFSIDPDKNKAEIDAFLSTWVTGPHARRGEPVTGCEINFNREFPKGRQSRSTAEILADIANLDAELATLSGGAA